jgi:general secretion pathway protein N
MPARRRLVAAGLAALVCGIVVSFPARVAWHWFAPPGIALAGIDGTVWRGSASEASAGGIYLRDLEWRWLPSRLFAGEMAVEFDVVPGNGTLSGRIGAGLNGSVRITGLRGSLPVPLFDAAVGMQGLEGTARIDLPVLVLDDGVPTEASGAADVTGLLIPVVTRAPLGSFRVEFQTQEGKVVASVQDVDAVVQLAGRLQFTGERNYEFLGFVAPARDTPPDLLRQMQFLGSADAQGRYELRLSGQL